MTDISTFHVRRHTLPRLRIALEQAAIFDRVVALILLPIVLCFLTGLLLVVLLAQGRPFFYGSERMSATDRSFQLWKIRTMKVSPHGACTVLGGDKADAVTSIGRILRRLRLDELPQIFNVLNGDMRFVGPRPPLRRYVEAYPEIYKRVLTSKPGITGLATVVLHRREDRILSKCLTAEMSDRAYRTYCIVPKARLDILHQHRRSLALDALIVAQTFRGLSSTGSTVKLRRRRSA